jgi:hypothetical protein
MIPLTFLEFSDSPNKNGRIYKKDSIDDSVIWEYQQKINESNALGELNPQWSNDNGEIRLSNVSHLVTSIEKTDEGLIGDIKILKTPCGNIVKRLLTEGLGVSISCRMNGIVNDDGTVQVSDIKAFDLIPNSDGFDMGYFFNKRYRFNKNKK